ncbi:MAG: T9SS type A sorting domain-containing protein [Bacteroidota bacterium]|nr:T9SS type A sorting domain-containing protein [Bacteroidota bacterium]
MKLEIIDLLGRNVATLVDEKQPAGVYGVAFHSVALSSGVYFYRLLVNSHIIVTRKMILLH